MGPSGSGKTTLLNLIGGLDAPSGGSISVGGERIDQLGDGALAKWRAANVGFVFQFYNLMPMLSAQQQRRAAAAADQAVRARSARSTPAIALQLVGLADRATHKPTRALRRPAAARGDRARDRLRPDPAGLRRADRRPRPAIGRGDAGAAAACSTASTARRSSWSRTIRRRPSTRTHTLHLDKGTLVEQRGQRLTRRRCHEILST